MVLEVFQFVACRTLDTYTHVTPDMRQQASGIVGCFMEDLLGKELKPWQENEKPEKEAFI